MPKLEYGVLGLLLAALSNLCCMEATTDTLLAAALACGLSNFCSLSGLLHLSEVTLLAKDGLEFCEGGAGFAGLAVSWVVLKRISGDLVSFKVASHSGTTSGLLLRDGLSNGDAPFAKAGLLVTAGFEAAFRIGFADAGGGAGDSVLLAAAKGPLDNTGL